MVLGLLATVGLCVLEFGVYGGAVDVQSAYATYGYFGTGRRVSLSLGNSIAQTYGSGASFSGLDRFGRPIDLHFKLGANTVHQYQYGYDTAGNRLFAEVEQDDGHDNDRSWAYTYDALSRLVTAHIGQLDGSDPRAIVAEPNLPNRRLEWNLDILGNWTGDPNNPGFNRYVDADGDDTFDAGAEIKHAVNRGNALTSVTTTDLSSNSVTQSYLYDGSGNLIFDGQLFYQYDAFNRLMQVNLAGDLTVNDFDMNAPAGRLKPGVADDAGQKLAAFVYDGFGRLIRTQRWDPQGNSEIESYYYDGVRRVQERVDDDPNDPNSTIATREYVWGPGYVDEIVCQVDEQGDLLYYLQDANYNVVAVTDEDGAVVAQYAYEPYGGVIAADAFTTTAYPDPNSPPTNRIGHQGLFFERLYVDPDDPNDPNDTYDTLSDPALSPPVDPNLATPLPGLYQVRNRVLIPNLGRFAQRDMNETALPIITALALNAEAMDAVIEAFSANAHYAASLNLYAFTDSNPITGLDPSGLYDPFDEVDATIVGIYAARASAAADFYRFFKKTAIVASHMVIESMVATLVPGGVFIVSGYNFALAAADVSDNGLDAWNGSALILSALPFANSMFNSFYGQMTAMRMQRATRTCFLGGTFVVLANGSSVPIETLRPGDEVLALSEDGISVTTEVVLCTHEAVVDQYYVVCCEAHDCEFRVTGEHPVWISGTGWTRVDAIQSGAALRDYAGIDLEVIGTYVERELASVYNLTVSGSGTYFVSPCGFLVHNKPVQVAWVSRGTTGRWKPANLREQLAMESAMANPAAGTVLTRVTMSDRRWPASEGWVKMAQHVEGIEVHYVYNTNLGVADDFKFK